MKTILSFDVGYRNLAYCLASVTDDQFTIKKYGLKDFGKVRSVCQLVPNLITFLRNTFTDCNWDYVVIENQVGSKLRSIQFVIQTYFETVKPVESSAVTVVAATVKFVGCTEKIDTRTYAKRKDASVEVVTRLLFGGGEDSDEKKWFFSHDKLDDLADCLLQAVGFCKKKKILRGEFVCQWAHKDMPSE